MKKFIVLFCLILLLLPILAAEEYILPEIINPSMIKVGEQKLFVVEGTNIFVYSLADYRLKTKFGTEGEGPREFKQAPVPWVPSLTLYFQENNLFINSMGKVSIFSKDGKFVSEKRTPAVGIFGRFIPVGDRIIMMKLHEEEGKSLVLSNLVDRELNLVREICRTFFPEQTGKKRNPISMAKMADLFDRFAYGDRFVLPIDEDGTIKVFDRNGKEILSFLPEYTKVNMTASLEKRLDNFFINHGFYKAPYLNDKGQGLITFGSHLPIFNYYRLADGKIYIISNFRKEGKYETFVYDFEGKLQKKTFLPLTNLDIFNVYPFDIKNGRLFQLIYNEDDEEMKLVITTI